MTSAFELVDWLRLVDVKPSPADTSRLASVVWRFYEPALWSLINFLHPSDGHLWDSDILKSLPDWYVIHCYLSTTFSMLLDRLPVEGVFSWLYFHTTLSQLQDGGACETLLTALYAQPVTLGRLENAIRLITNSIGVSTTCHHLTAALLALLSDVLARARGTRSEKDLRRLKATVFQRDTIQELCVSPNLVSEISEGVGLRWSIVYNSNNSVCSNPAVYCSIVRPCRYRGPNTIVIYWFSLGGSNDAVAFVGSIRRCEWHSFLEPGKI